MKQRPDSHGLIWSTSKKEPPKKVEPPERVWESPTYLPYLEEARAFNVSLFTTEELIQAHSRREILICDVEIFLNYFLCAFTSLYNGKVIHFELSPTSTFDRNQLSWVLRNFKIVTFNGNYFDIPILALACAGFSTEQLKHASSKIINEEIKPWLVLRSHKVEPLRLDHIDLIEVAPLSESLKIYGGRLHVPKMQELPFHHNAVLTPDQIAVVRWYCINSDLTATAFLYMKLEEQIKLRESMSQKYGVDLRSKSDAQIAEAVISNELARLTGSMPERTSIEPGTMFQYQVPANISFQMPELNHMLEVVSMASFMIQENGSPHTPKEIAELKVQIAGKEYQMGIGGLHSCETCVAHFTDSEYVIKDADVASYYPAIILNQGLYPKHLGFAFLEVYRTLVERRLAAKKSGNKVEADSLKIVANGSFGKFGNKYSVLYAPDLMLQVTVSGQLYLLMLIERLEMEGISVVSANTDGVLVRCHKSMLSKMAEVVAVWEGETGFKTEETQYSAFYARDINSYIGIKTDGKAKVKGCYAERGSAGDSVLSKNPVNLICLDALQAFLVHGTSISSTIRSCRDFRRFVSVRKVKGGAVKDGQYLGKAIRWYQSNKVTGDIIYAVNGNKVPNSENCRPCMELPRQMPEDIDFARYEGQTLEMLKEIGYR